MPIPPTWNQGLRPILPEGGIACMGGTPVVGRWRGPDKTKLAPGEAFGWTGRTAEYFGGPDSVDELAVAPPVPFQDCLPASLFIDYGSRFNRCHEDRIGREIQDVYPETTFKVPQVVYASVRDCDVANDS